MNSEKVEEAWRHKLKKSQEYVAAKRQQLDEDIIQRKRETFKQAAESYQQTATMAREQAWDDFC